ncbi:MAG: radical SAM protein [Chloroflexi bacterium]|nr:radical SAM protein [Chloroflexota bacterium]
MVNPLLSALKPILYFAEARLQANGGVPDTVADGRRQQRSDLALRYFSWRKLFNLLRVEVALRFGFSRLGGTPYEWEIDTTNICQLKCPLCHTGLGTIKRDKGVMHYDLYTKTIDQIKNYVVWLTLYSWGEPFLNKRIHDMVGYAHEKGIATIISSNLNKPFTEKEAEMIIKSGLDTMIISLDGITQEIYEIYRVNGHLDRVLDNIRLLVRKKKELGYTTPYLEWQFIVMRQNEHQIGGARELAKELGVDSIIFKKVDFPHGEDNDKTAKRWLPQNTPEYLRGNAFDKPFKEGGTRCWRLWRTAVVNWDGGFAPCCYLTDKTDDFGDLNVNSVQEIKNNSNYVTSRALFKKRTTPDHRTGCLTCPVYTETAVGIARGPVTFPTPPSPILTMAASRNGASGDAANVARQRGDPKAPLAETGPLTRKAIIGTGGATGERRLETVNGSHEPQDEEAPSQTSDTREVQVARKR